jgi:hypothetical protein
MLLGVQNGDLMLYNNITAVPDAAFNLITNNWGNVYVGRRVNPDVADLNNDGFFELILGNERGGIDFFRTNAEKMSVSASGPSVLKTISLYPNPVRDILYLYNDPEFKRYSLFSITGKLLMSGNLQTGMNELNLSNISPGIYILRADDNGSATSIKINKI